MQKEAHSLSDLRRLYEKRFDGKDEYRNTLWGVLAKYFERWIPPAAVVLDLGAGYCEFINHVEAGTKYAMDINPEIRRRARPGVCIVEQDSAEEWPLPDAILDVVFSSNVFEHFPTKRHLERTLSEAHRALKAGGLLIALGPNIKYLGGQYWDFYDHCLPLTERSLAEALAQHGFDIAACLDRFLPYTMSAGYEYPPCLLKAYLALPLVWKWFGKQFLLVASKPGRSGASCNGDAREEVRISGRHEGELHVNHGRGRLL